MSSTAPSATPSAEAAPATRPGALARAPVLYLYSGDDTLLLELGPVLGARYRTRPIDSTEQIAPPGAGAWALLIDATARADARAQAARVKQQYPQAPLLVVCADGAAADWAGPRSRGTICAVVERQAITGPEFEAALEAVDRQLGQAASAEAAAAPAARVVAGSWPMRIALALAALATAAATWYFLHGAPGPALHSDGSRPRGAASLSTSTALPAAPAPAGRPVVELLSDARVAFSEERRQLPPADAAATGDSALELYARVLTLDPRNEEARDGMRRLFAVASVRVRTDLAAGRFDDASRLLAALAGQGIADDALTGLQAELAAARPRWLATQVRAAIAAGDGDSAARLLVQLAASGADRATLANLQQSMDSQQADARLVALARRVHTAINSGVLIEPAADSAQALVQQMQQLNRDHPLTIAAQQELQAALAERSRAQHEAEAARARARAAAPAPAPAVVPPPAPPPAAPADDFLAARPAAPLDVSYPQRAFEAGQKGYVIVEFTLDAAGRATNAYVVESSPPSVFDAAALQAVRRGRFDASALGVPAKPQRARLRISFKP